MLVGTNPNCIELPMIAGHENPLFSSIPSQFVPSFTIPQTREMVRKLGKYMGLRFDEMVYSKLVEDFGGHPFLIRQFCSSLHNSCPGDRPVDVDRALYNKVMNDFLPTAYTYLDMIVSVLKDWYPDEFDMLRFLAQGDETTFRDFATDHIRFTKHLIGYGLITQSEHGYVFNIEALRKYLVSTFKYERLHLSEEEKIAEISSRRNQLEKKLRTVVRSVLKARYGKLGARDRVLSVMHNARKEKISSLEYETILSRDSSPLFLLELIDIIKRDWDLFKNIFEIEKLKFSLILEEINSKGRPDAHAKGISEDDFNQLRLHFKTIEGHLDDWLK